MVSFQSETRRSLAWAGLKNRMAGGAVRNLKLWTPFTILWTPFTKYLVNFNAKKIWNFRSDLEPILEEKVFFMVSWIMTDALSNVQRALHYTSRISALIRQKLLFYTLIHLDKDTQDLYGQTNTIPPNSELVDRLRELNLNYIVFIYFR